MGIFQSKKCQGRERVWWKILKNRMLRRRDTFFLMVEPCTDHRVHLCWNDDGIRDGNIQCCNVKHTILNARKLAPSRAQPRHTWGQSISIAQSKWTVRGLRQRPSMRHQSMDENKKYWHYNTSDEIHCVLFCGFTVRKCDISPFTAMECQQQQNSVAWRVWLSTQYPTFA